MYSRVSYQLHPRNWEKYSTKFTKTILPDASIFCSEYTLNHFKIRPNTNDFFYVF